jgi:hypothetical protein
MQQKRQQCINFDQAARQKFAERYFVRACNFRQICVSRRNGKFNYPEPCNLKCAKLNLYKTNKNVSHKIQVRFLYNSTFGAHMVTARVDSGLETMLRFSDDDDFVDLNPVSHCWRTRSSAQIFYEYKQKLYLEKVASVSRFFDVGSSVYPHHLTAFHCSSTQYSYYCLILSWFDRIDRTLFWKCLSTLIQSSSWQKASQSDVSGLFNCTSLCIFIQQYL